MRSTLKLLGLLNRAICWIIGIFFAVSTVAVLIQVIVRFVLPKMGLIVSAPWTEESSRFLVTWCVFLGVAVLCRDARLISVEMFAHLIPRAAGKIVKALGVLVTIFFFCCLLWTGSEWTQMSSIEASPVMRLPMNWIYLAMPVGSALAIVNLLAFLSECLTGQRDLLAESDAAEAE
jgi:TRAP-type C4-dicarboxylate transport system permease small subunit